MRQVSPFRASVYALVRSIPEGRVLSYGAVAALLGRPRSARGVGTALSGLPEGHDVPWWRVVNRNGEITSPRIHHIAVLQKKLLEGEGVKFSASGRIDLRDFAWSPDPESEGRPSPKKRRIGKRPEGDGDGSVT